MQSDTYPNGSVGCVVRENKFCKICNCACTKGVKLCFECSEFPYETTKIEPIRAVTVFFFVAAINLMKKRLTS